MTDLPPPSSSEIPAGVSAVSPSSSWWKRRLQVPVWAVVLAALLVVGSLGVAAGKDDPKPTNSAGSTNASSTAPTTSAASDTTEAQRTTTTRKATTTTAAPTIGTRDNPVPVSIPMPAGDWTYEVVAFEPDVTSLAMSYNQFNDPPPAGQVISRLRIKAIYGGQGSGSPFSIDINLVGAGGKTYKPCSCVAGGSGGDPGDMLYQAETFSGGFIEGWFYYTIDLADAGGPMIAFDPNVNYSDVPGGTAFFAVN